MSEETARERRLRERRTERLGHEPREVRIADPRAIRALAHKVRLDVIDELFGTERSYTATDLAGRFGLSPSAMSYHLRALEKWGYVVRAENGGDARERHWKAAGDSLRIGAPESGQVPEPSSLVASSAVVDLTLNAVRERIHSFLRRTAGITDPHELPPAAFASTKLWLTDAQAKDLTAAIGELQEKYRLPAGEHEGPAGAQKMYMMVTLVPDRKD